MSAISTITGKQQVPAVDWSRLIPGEVPAFQPGAKRPPRSVRPFAPRDISEVSAWPPRKSRQSSPSILLPAPLQTRTAYTWVLSMAIDFALITSNWLLIGSLLVLSRTFLPSAKFLSGSIADPFCLLGLATLHAALITLMSYTEGLQLETVNLRRQTRILGKSIAWATTVLCFAYALQGSPWSTSALFCAAGALHFGSLWMWRSLSLRQRRLPERNTRARNVLIVGAGKIAQRIASHLADHPETGIVVCGFLDNDQPIGRGVLGRVNDMARLSRTSFIDEVIIAAPQDRNVMQQALREACRLRLDVALVPDLLGCKPTAGDIGQVGEMPAICLHAERLPAAALVAKRIMDVVGAMVALLFLSPLLATIAGLIKLDSPGPVLYSACRAGRKGRLFHCHKFRTMVTNADDLKDELRAANERSGPFFKIANDPRVTRLGHWLRRYSLDELPQLWNVLKGEMSLVGPRPHPMDDVASYEIGHLGRLDVTPGITGLWQVTARRDPSFQRGIELDREYIRTWSLRSDLRILLKTFLAVLQGSGD